MLPFILWKMLIKIFGENVNGLRLLITFLKAFGVQSLTKCIDFIKVCLNFFGEFLGKLNCLNYHTDFVVG